MKAATFAYARARDVDHALALWEEAGAEARLLAGGQSLAAGLALRLSDPPALVDINHLAELRGIVDLGDRLRIGALTRHAELATNPLIAQYVPALAQAAPLIAHPAIRNRGTVGGSIAYADPAAELPACIVALDAEIVTRGRQGERRVSGASFFKGLYETDLQPFEMIAAVEFLKTSRPRRHVVMELARRNGDYALTGIVLAADFEGHSFADTRIAYFGLGATPVLARGAMAAVECGDLDSAVRALEADLDPPDDLHSSAHTKRHLAGVLLRRALAAARHDVDAGAEE